MNKWETFALQMVQAEKENDNAKSLSVAICIFVEFAQMFEQMGADVDRIATALEARGEPVTQHTTIEPEVVEKITPPSTSGVSATDF